MFLRQRWIHRVASVAALALAACAQQATGGAGEGGAFTAPASSSGSGGGDAASSSSGAAVAPGACLGSRRFGGADFQSFSSVAVHPSSGSLLAAGLNMGVVDLGDGPLTDPPGGIFQLVIARFGPKLDLVWSKGFNATGPGATFTASHVAFDAAGDAFIAGTFAGTVNFGGGPLVSAGQTDVFVAELDPKGQHLWSRRFGDAGSEFVRGFAMDAQGSLFLAGIFNSSIDFGGGPLSSAGDNDVFVAKLDPKGQNLYSRAFGTKLNDQCDALAVDAKGRAIFGGRSTGTLDLGGGPLAPGGYVAALDSKGKHAFSQGFSASAFGPWVEGLTVDPQGDVVAVGTFKGTFAFGPDMLTSSTDAQGLPAYDFFALKLDAGGGLQWARDFPAHLGNTPAIAVAAGEGGEVVLSGNMSGGVDFGGGPLPPAKSVQVFTAALDAAGKHLWSQSFGDDKDHFASAVAVGSSGAAIVVGSFDGTIDFGCGALKTAGSQDMFIASFGP